MQILDRFMSESRAKGIDVVKQISGRFRFPAFDCPADTLITARSHLIDRMVPDVEIIRLPAKKTGGGTLAYVSKEKTSFPTEKSGTTLSRIVNSRSNAPIDVSKPFLDFRLRTPQNWAHFLNNHLPIFFAISADSGQPAQDTLAILPANTPGHICHAAGVFGLETVCTDRPVSGTAIEFTSEPWTGIRSIRHEWARLPMVTDLLSKAGIIGKTESTLPTSVFISRRDSRTLENEREVEAFLKEFGYCKIYAEDLSVGDQFRLFQQAENIVAIHGAAIAPLLYISGDTRLRKLVELFPCGHMTDVYRVMCHQVGCHWIGVRGKIKPEHIQPAYDLSKPFTKYSLQSFEIDIASLEYAMDLLRNES